ncbi:MAG TPA: PAS domain S-box protein [Longimicrobium sp.]|nr:PAS domain S-box protein [Longimicrobium sp.]
MSEITSWPTGGGETGALIRGRDWPATPLGPVDGWPAALRTAVDIMLESPEPTSVGWGPGCVQLYNDAYARLVHERHPALFGRPALEGWADVRAALQPILDTVFAGAAVVEEDRAVLLPGPARGRAEPRWFTFTFVPIHDDRGGVAGVFHRLVETTERKRAEAALRESEERHRLIVESARDYAILMIGPDRRITSWSPGAQAVYGWRGDEVLGRDFSLLFVPEDREAGAPEWELATAVEHGAAPDVRWHLRADGSRVFVDGTTRAVRGGDGALTGFLKIGQDVTGRRRVEEALRESEERYRLIVEGARDYAILTTDPDRRITGWSPGAEAVYGWTAGEATGQDVAMTFTPEDRAAGVPRLECATAAAQGWAPDVRWHLRSDGARVFIEGVTRALYQDGGALRGFLKVGQDVTERRRMDQALRELNETLEQRVEARTAELERANASLGEMQAELLSTNEMLTREIDERERADQARRELLRQLVTAEEQERARLSRELHDSVGQVVTALLLGLKALEREPGGPPAGVADLERLAGQIAREIHHVAAALRPPALDRLGLRRALEAHLEEWSRRYGVACDYQPLNVDDQRFEPEVETTLFRAVQEGLTNVARHAGARTVTLVLERRPGTVGVILEDDGAGFDVEPAMEAAARARRMGLPGLRERVELLGGTLEVESAPGSGTTLFVRLPDLGTPVARGMEVER